MTVEKSRILNFLDSVPFKQRKKNKPAIPVIKAEPIKIEIGTVSSTQIAFGKLMAEVAKQENEFSRRVVTTSPDVTVSTNLSGWVNRKGLFKRERHIDVFREEQVLSTVKWEKSPKGQHIELGIAENNLFLMLAAMGLSEDLFGARLLPVGTIYDTFISRGLDALNYACYQDSRFILVATPSGISLAPEGGAHQSIATPLIGMAQDGLASFEPAFADELQVVMSWSFDYIQRRGKGSSEVVWLRDKQGGAVYLRLSTREINQPSRLITAEMKNNIIAGGYWLRFPKEKAELAIVFMGAVAPEAIKAWEKIIKKFPGTGLLCVTSADRLNAGWNARRLASQKNFVRTKSHIEQLLAPLARQAGLVTVLDGHPVTLAWIGGVRGQKTISLGVEHFGQSGDIKSLYSAYRIDPDSIISACLEVCQSHATISKKL